MCESIRVAVRIRDLLPRERDHVKKEPLAWAWDGSAHQIWPTHGVPPAKKFTFDGVYTPQDDNGAVYASLLSAGIDSVVQGFNATVFAYGQTASGKTHTMLGTESDPGLIRRSIDTIFQRIAELSHQKEFLMRVSYLEIYNEHVNDLFVEPKKRKKIVIREDANGNTVFDNLEEIPICSQEDIFTLMEMGQHYRRVGETNMNERSSRSHTILRVIVESSTVEMDEDTSDDAPPDGGSTTSGTAITVSHLNLVDLAGSERANQTGAVGERLREGSNINKSLLVLGQVISKLSEGSKEHIPFRESKLTRILKDSLGGNAKTTIICTVTPAEREQTKSTLEFASRAKTIVQHVHKNEFLDNGAELVRLKKEIKALSEALEREKQKKGTALEIKVVEGPNQDHSEELKQIELKRIQLLQDLRDKILKPVESDTKTQLDVITKNRAKEDFKRRQSWHPAALNRKRLSLGLALKPAQNEVSIDEEFRLRLVSLQNSNRDLNGKQSHPNSDHANEEEYHNDNEDGDMDEGDRLELNDTLAELPKNPMNMFPDCLGFDDLNDDLITDRRTSKRRRRVRFSQEDEDEDLDHLESPPPRIQIRNRRASQLMVALDLDTSGTPRTILKDRIKLKDDTIKKLSSEFKELEEFTRMESEVLEEEKKRIELKAVEDMKRSLNTLKHEKSLLEGRLEAMKAEKAKAEERLKFLQEENEGFWLAKYEGEKTSLRQSELQNGQVLVRDLDAALAEVQDLKNTINELKSEIGREEVVYEKKIEAIKMDCEVKIQSLEVNAKEIQAMREKCRAYEQQIEALVKPSKEEPCQPSSEELSKEKEQELEFESRIQAIQSESKSRETELLNQLQECEKKIQALQQQAKQVDQPDTDKESLLKDKDQELCRLQTSLEDLEKKLQMKEEESLKKSQEVEAHQRKEKELVQTISKLEADLQIIDQDKATQVQKIVSDYEAKIQLLQDQNENQLSQEKSKAADLEEQASQLNLKLGQVENQLSQEKVKATELEEQTSLLNQKLGQEREKATKLEEQASQFNLKLGQTENQLAQEKSKTVDLEEQTSLLNRKLGQAEESLSTTRKTLDEERLKVEELINQAQFNNEEQVLRQRCQELQETINTLESDIVIESAAREDYQQQVQSWQESRKIVEQEKHDLQVQLKSQQDQMESLREEIQGLKQIQEVSNHVKAQLLEVQDQNQSLAKTLQECQQHVVSLQAEIEELQTLKKTEEMHLKNQVASLNQEIQDLKELKSSNDESLSKGIQAKNDLIQEYQMKVQSLSKEIEEWKQLEQGFLRSKDSFDLAMCHKNQENQALNAKLLESESEIQSFRDVCENLSTQIHEEKTKSEDLGRQISTWESKAENFQQIQEDLANLKKERSEFEGLSEFADSVQRDLAKVEDLCQALKKDLEEERQKSCHILEENQSLHKQVETLQSGQNQQHNDAIRTIQELETRNQDLLDELENALSFEKLANNLQQAIRDKEELLQKTSSENLSLNAKLQDLSSQSKVPELEAKLHEALIENATLKVKVEREDLEFKKKCKVLTENLAFEKDEVHNLRDKLRRVQREKMDATIMPMSRDNAIDLKPSCQDAQTMTESHTIPEEEDKEPFEKVMAKYEKGYWSQGSGIVKEYALDVANARIAELKRKCDNFKEESNHYESKAREWKKEALQLRHNQKKLQEKLASGATIANKPSKLHLEVLQESQTQNQAQPVSEKGTVASATSSISTMRKAPDTPDEDAEYIANFKLDFNKCDPDPFRKMPKTPKKTPMKKKLSTPMKENCKQQ